MPVSPFTPPACFTFCCARKQQSPPPPFHVKPLPRRHRPCSLPPPSMHPSDRLYVRLSDELAALVGREEVFEDELLETLREKGLITYPSLLGSFLGNLPEVFEKEVLPLLDATDRALLARVDRACNAAVVTSGLAHAGGSREAPLKVQDFVGSVERLAWAKANRCPWEEKTTALASRMVYVNGLLVDPRGPYTCPLLSLHLSTFGGMSWLGVCVE